MLDTETFGLSPDSLIVSIGGVFFDETGLGVEGYWPLELNQLGRVIDPGTIAWWLQQSDEARQVFHPDVERHTIYEALTSLASAIEKDTLVWSNGADFDLPLLANAYKAIGMTTPWGYKNTRCFRTLRAQFPDVEGPVGLTKHNALDDAKWQASFLVEVMTKHNLELR